MDPGWETWVSGRGVNCWFSRGAATAEESQGLEITVPKTVLEIFSSAEQAVTRSVRTLFLHNGDQKTLLVFTITVSELKSFWELHHCSFDSGVPPPFVMALRLTTDLQSITRHSHTVWRVSRSHYTHGILNQCSADSVFLSDLAGVRYMQQRCCSIPNFDYDGDKLSDRITRSCNVWHFWTGF